jgi:hypothetical protein
MATILFDKMRAARKLEGEGNFTRQQAETRSEVLHDSMPERVATKTDLDALGIDLKASEMALRADMGLLRADMGVLRVDLKTTETALRSDLKAEIALLQAKIAETRTQIIIWVAGLMLASGVLQHFLR